MAQCKTAVTPLLTHWSYCSLALSHQYGIRDLGSSLIQVITCDLFGTKPLPEPMGSYCQLDPSEKKIIETNLNHDTKIFYQENAFENIAWQATGECHLTPVMIIIFICIVVLVSHGLTYKILQSLKQRDLCLELSDQFEISQVSAALLMRHLLNFKAIQ